ncbi:hypothetical protein RR48_12779 [Papilio machaon]|uniref:Uncharacterized protein n=1 Tax=Papilio machaon TaxID=76193 RepID=A0A194QR15_PAPMA|nr:hypothetical protein RR48_12779 [Papilio machaon]
MKHDVDRIMSQHSYAHPHPDIVVTRPQETVQIKEEDWDKGDIFYTTVDEANDCITIEVPCDDPVKDEVVPVSTDLDLLTLTNNSSDLTLECDLKLLSPMTLSPNSDENLLGVSPSHTSLSSDLGYESLASPLSEPESMDLSDFWCESFSELFPDLT